MPGGLYRSEIRLAYLGLSHLKTSPMVMALQNTETSSSASTASFFSLPPLNLKKNTAAKVPYLYEINHIPEDQDIRETTLPPINLYKASTKPFTSFFKSVKAFLNPFRHNPRECIQVTRFDKHTIPSGEQEQFITLQIPPESIQRLIAQGYPFVHFGAIRLGLTFHGREGFPVATRIALLDSRNSLYQKACLAIVEKTLNAGTFFVTLFANVSLPLKDSDSVNVFLVHMQIVGAPMNPGLIQATLRSQMAYKVHHFYGSNLPLLPRYGDLPLIQVDSQNVISTTHIPRDISRKEFVSILPETWVTNYENRKTEERGAASSLQSLKQGDPARFRTEGGRCFVEKRKFVRKNV